VGFTSSSPSQHESHLPMTGVDKEKRDRADERSVAEKLPVRVARVSAKLFVVQALPVLA
jgi:hypothetical protein